MEIKVISHKNEPPNNGHNWEAVAIFVWDAANNTTLEQRPLLWIKCRECEDQRIIIGEYLPKG